MKGFGHFLRITSCKARNASDAMHFLPEEGMRGFFALSSTANLFTHKPEESIMSLPLKSLVITAASLIGVQNLAHAQQPPDIVTSENGNTAMGTSALSGLSSGTGNTAAGQTALQSNSTGGANSAFGEHAVFANQSGNNNTGLGYSSLYSNTTGNGNTAVGYHSMFENLGASFNTAVGYQSLFWNQSGGENTAIGNNALVNNISGGGNTATGSGALLTNQDGEENVAVGLGALYSISSGSFNTAIGTYAMENSKTGGNNIAIGYLSGYSLSGSNNIDIGASGASTDNGIIRIGEAPDQTAAYIAGIYTTKLTGSAVYVNSKGQLGVLASSERYKTEIESLGKTTQRLEQLRPVSFHLKSDPGGAIQYGLIAEEVDKVYPELVIRDDKGVIQGVRYDELAPMLLNVVQQQNATMRTQAKDLAAVRAESHAATLQLAAVQLTLAKFVETNREMQAELSQMKARDARLAMR
jgi:hypothetical protein